MLNDVLHFGIFVTYIFRCFVEGELQPETDNIVVTNPLAVTFKNAQERSLLKELADKIYGSLDDDESFTDHDNIKQSEDHEEKKILQSVISMMGDHDQPLSSVESSSKIVKMLTHFISDASQQMKRQHDQATLKIPESNMEHSVKSIESDDSKANPKTFIFKTNDGNTHANVGATNNFFHKFAEGANKVFQAITKTEGNVADGKFEPAKKLIPHIVFTDADGREYHLVGAKNRGERTCPSKCLSCDEDSKELLIFEKPTSADYLIIADSSGKKYFTDGAKICDNFAKHIGGDMPDFSHKKREIIGSKNSASIHSKISAKWEDSTKAKVVKRDKTEDKEFRKDVDALFSGRGLNEKSNQEKNSKARGENEKFAKKSRNTQMKRLVNRRRRYHPNIKQNNFRRQERNLVSHDVKVNANDNESNTLKIPESGKILDNLKRKSSELEGEKATSEKCKKFCKSRDENTRPKRSLNFQSEDDLQRQENFIPLGNVLIQRQNYTTDHSGPVENHFKAVNNNEVIPLSENGIKIISIEPDVETNDAPFMQTTPEYAEEINMIQPSSAPEDEMMVLLTTTSTNNRVLHSDEKYKTDLRVLDDVSLEEPLRSLMQPIDFLVPRYMPISSFHNDFNDELLRNDLRVESSTSDADSTESTNTDPDTTEDSSSLSDVQDSSDDEPDSAQIGGRFAEAIFFHVQNTYSMKEILGSSLNLSPATAFSNSPSIRGPAFKNALNILLKAIMVNIKKIAEEEAKQMSCVPIEVELQEFLAALLGAPQKTVMPDAYHTNIAPAESYDILMLRRNELLDLLEDYNQLSPNEKKASIGVKSFIESELAEVNRRVPEGKIKSRGT